MLMGIMAEAAVEAVEELRKPLSKCVEWGMALLLVNSQERSRRRWKNLATYRNNIAMYFVAKFVLINAIHRWKVTDEVPIAHAKVLEWYKIVSYHVAVSRRHGSLWTSNSNSNKAPVHYCKGPKDSAMNKSRAWMVWLLAAMTTVNDLNWLRWLLRAWLQCSTKLQKDKNLASHRGKQCYSRLEGP